MNSPTSLTGCTSNLAALSEPVYVTRPSLPSAESVKEIIDSVWASGFVTNSGAYHQKFEKSVKQYLQAENVAAVTNGHSALEIAIRALDLTGEVITSPFTFPSTVHAIALCNLQPVFADIDPETYTIDPKSVEQLITPKTSAILAVHVYGNPANVTALQNIADRHGLKIIYDAAHAFGVKIGNQGISQFGNISAFSFHATKVYSTIEGGLVVSNSDLLRAKCSKLRNFGYPENSNDQDIELIGGNAKMNEISAGIGLLNLELVDAYIEQRKAISVQYDDKLEAIAGLKKTKMIATRPNYAYYPVRINTDKFGMSRDDLASSLCEHNIHARKYFWPLCSELSCYRHTASNRIPLPVAEEVSQEILCLPLYPGLEPETVSAISEIIISLSCKCSV